jgi:hypothetical protein
LKPEAPGCGSRNTCKNKLQWAAKVLRAAVEKYVFVNLNISSQKATYPSSVNSSGFLLFSSFRLIIFRMASAGFIQTRGIFQERAPKNVLPPVNEIYGHFFKTERRLFVGQGIKFVWRLLAVLLTLHPHTVFF